MLRVVLVDDEKLSLDELDFILNENSELEVVGKYSNPLKALEFIKKTKPDIVFLDIEMPELDGFTLAEEIWKMDFSVNIVFATVFDKYAIKAFEMDAIDYVLKPFSEERLQVTVNRIIERHNSNNELHSYIYNNNNLISENKIIKSIKKLPLWKEDCIFLVNPDYILYCTVINKEVFVLTKDDNYTTQYTLGQLEKKLINYNFFRCHKSYLVNLDKIHKIIPWFNSTFMLKIEGWKEDVPVSRHYVKDFKKILNM